MRLGFWIGCCPVLRRDKHCGCPCCAGAAPATCCGSGHAGDPVVEELPRPGTASVLTEVAGEDEETGGEESKVDALSLSELEEGLECLV